jgi:hypothetical protein
MPLPDPPLLQQVFLESPGPLLVPIAVAGVALWFVAGRQANAGGQRAAYALLGAAALLYLTAALVTTPREALLARTTLLLTLVEQQQFDTFFNDISAPDGPTLRTRDFEDICLDAARIRRELPDVLGRARIVRNRIESANAVDDGGGRGRSVIDVLTTIDTHVAGETRVRTRWLFHWQQDEAGVWRLDQVQWMDHPGFGPNVIQPNCGLWSL